ncbi:hypothetical protein GGF43_005865, partial [Coemansia sp. RSA 2618]
MLRATALERTPGNDKDIASNKDTTDNTESTNNMDTVSDKPVSEKKMPLIQRMALRPQPSGLAQMVAKIAAQSSTQGADSEIEKMRFTAPELIRDLPKYYSNVMSESMQDSKAAIGGIADLSTFSLDKTTELLNQIRESRASEIQQMFSQQQLGAYLRQHGQAATGTKRVQIKRIIAKVWGITTEGIREQCKQIGRKADEDGMVMPLNSEAVAQLSNIENEYLRELERQFGVHIVLDTQKKTVRVTGIMHNVRGALSRLRDKLAGDRMVQMDMERYGTLRPLSHMHVSMVTNTVNQTFGDDGTVVYFDGELLARGHTRADTLDIQQALIDAFVEPEDSTLFVVVPKAAAESESATIVAAADMISKPRTFIPKYTFFTLPSTDSSSPASVLLAHT